MQHTEATKTSEDAAPDSEDRIQDFFARHGGAGRCAVEETLDSGVRGWSEVYAADGYTLRCDWSRSGTLNELSYSEIAPPPAAASTDGME